MNRVKVCVCYVFLALLLAMIPGVANAVPILVDFSSLAMSLDANVGFSYTQPGWGFTLSARSEINRDTPGSNSLTGGIAGNVFIGEIDRLGTANQYCVGVKANDGSGSRGISGGKKHQDESLVFTFDTPQLYSDISIEFCGITDDDVIYTSVAFGGGTQTFANIEGFLVPGSSVGLYTFDYSSLTPGGGELMVSSFAVRSTEGHFAIGSISTTPVPEPATLAMLAMGLGGLAAAQRTRRRRKLER